MSRWSWPLNNACRRRKKTRFAKERKSSSLLLETPKQTTTKLKRRDSRTTLSRLWVWQTLLINSIPAKWKTLWSQQETLQVLKCTHTSILPTNQDKASMQPPHKSWLRILARCHLTRQAAVIFRNRIVWDQSSSTRLWLTCKSKCRRVTATSFRRTISLLEPSSCKLSTLPTPMTSAQSVAAQQERTISVRFHLTMILISKKT